jgi:hypothetical protein
MPSLTESTEDDRMSSWNFSTVHRRSTVYSTIRGAPSYTDEPSSYVNHGEHSTNDDDDDDDAELQRVFGNGDSLASTVRASSSRANSVETDTMRVSIALSVICLYTLSNALHLHSALPIDVAP